MAWTTPRTWVTAEIPTASIFNTHVRDNFNETAPAKATGSGGIIVATAANTILQRTPTTAAIETSENTTSTSFTDLATAGPSISIVTGTSCWITVTAAMSNSSAGGLCRAAVEVSGASASSPQNGLSLIFESSAANDTMRADATTLYTALTAGTNVFKVQYNVSTGTGTFSSRRIAAIQIG